MYYNVNFQSYGYSKMSWRILLKQKRKLSEGLQNNFENHKSFQLQICDWYIWINEHNFYFFSKNHLCISIMFTNLEN
jgi:hypothetical protein